TPVTVIGLCLKRDVSAVAPDLRGSLGSSTAKCGQWLSSHKHILKSDTGDGKPLGIWFENLLGPNSRNEINRLLNWLDIDADEHLRHKVLEDLPPIMATQRPRRSRWFSRAALIQPQLERNEIQDVWRQLKHG
ncbi:MAG: hypothetical protein VX026_04965, partial [Myxococcota bacterium]|nr:hypothetical protein [Myxococcota bacterium]